MAGQEYWEFLLQQEGDRTWLPLESPAVEILEGRYRVMARSNYLNTELEIHITHEATEEVPPKRRTQRRANRTNREGLLVVIPFTMLRPGVWELACTSGVMTELMGTSCHYSVHLHVLPKELDTVGDWDPDWQAPQPLATAAPQLELVSQEPSEPEPAEILTATIAASATDLHELQPQDAVLAADLSATLDDLELEHAFDADLTDQEDQWIDGLQESQPRLAEQEDHWIGELQNAEGEHLTEGLTAESAPDTIANLASFSHANIIIGEPIADSWSDSLDVQLGNRLNDRVDDQISQSLESQFDDRSIDYSRETIIEDCSEELTDAQSTDLQTLPPLTLNLRSDSYEVQPEIALSIYGEIQAEQPCVLSDADLRAIVRDPQTGTIILQQEQRWQLRSLPEFFQISLRLPDPLPAQLMLGEVELCDRASQVVLTRHAFTLTANLEDLLANMTLQPMEALELGIDAPQPEVSSTQLDAAFANFIQTPPPASATPTFQVSSASQLPPQIYTPDPDREEKRSIDLPSFVKPAPPQPMDNVGDLFNETEASDAETLDLSDFPMRFPDQESPMVSEEDLLAELPLLEEELLGETLEEALHEDLFTSDASSAAASSTDNSGSDSELNDADLLNENLFDTEAIASDESDAEDESVQTIDVTATPLPDGLEARNLGDRFMNRLNSFAQDTRAEIQAATPQEPALPINPFAAPTGQHQSGQQEIVLEDFNPFSPLPNVGNHGESSGDTLHQQPNPFKISDDQAIPTPQLEIETVHEVVAGQSLLVKVKLPNLLPKLYVKLWINDRQTRTLLDGPRYLVDFVPNGHDELETITQLTVPMGSLEIQLEAIAIETFTKRESYKAIATIPVVPPNFSEVSIDDLNF
ncbi:MAG: hypothetical protein VKJ24_13695 [Synechococcales bacterium]|nr:hypothetical protein [Synechococcales bacterium]